MRPANIELLMGHEIGVSESYWRPTENELLDDYLKAVPLLSVNDNSTILEKQIEQVNERNRQENIIINTRISEGMNYLEHWRRGAIDMASRLSQPSNLGIVWHKKLAGILLR